jgi:hypothetical protein
MKGSDAPNAAEQDPMAIKISGFITEKWTDLKTAYWMYHSWIWGALLMYAGELWIEYAPDRKLYQRIVPKDDFVPTPRINKFAPAIDAIASNFQNVPEVEAVPTPLDDAIKIGISEVCNELATHFVKISGLRADYKNEEDKVGLAGQLFVLAGCFMTNTYIDAKEIGRNPVMDEAQGFEYQCTKCDTYESGFSAQPQNCPKCGNPDILTNPVPIQVPSIDEETQQPKTTPVTEAEVHCDIDNALFLYPRAGAKNMKQIGYFFIAERLSLDEIWRRWQIEAKADSEYPDGWNTTNENALNFFYLGYSNTSLSGKDAAMVIRAYCEPGQVKDYPDGFYAIYVNGSCKYSEPWRFEEHPLTKCDFKSIPTLIFPRSVAFDLVQIQKEKCDFWSIFKLHALTTAVDPWIVDKDSQTDEITGRGDRVVKYRKLSPDTVPPHHAQSGHLDPALYALDDKLDREFDNIGQTVAVFRGDQPGSVKAGVAIETLRAQAEFMFSGPVANWNDCWKETVRKGVKLMQKHYSLAQLVGIAGQNRTEDIRNFQSADLDESVEWIASRGGLPRTRDERRQEMIELYDRGLLDINDAEVKQKAFELFGETGLLTTFSEDAKRARYENALMTGGGDPVFMQEIDDHAVHLAIHGQDVKLQDFLRQPPEVQQKKIEHYLAHKQALTGQMAPPPPGAPGPGAGPAMGAPPPPGAAGPGGPGPT